MSSAEQQAAKQEAPPQPDPAPAPFVGEAERIRAEDPDFPVVLAKVRARHRGEEFDPEKHMPKEGKRRIDQVPKRVEEELEAIIQRFAQRGRGGRHLRAIDPKKAAANDVP
jgi:hypothetical protein